MSDLRTAAQQAMEAMETHKAFMPIKGGSMHTKVKVAIEALRTALAQQVEQQPVAWRFIDDQDNWHVSYSTTPPTDAQVAYLKKWNRPAWEPLYAAAPAPQGEKQ